MGVYVPETDLDAPENEDVHYTEIDLKTETDVIKTATDFNTTDADLTKNDVKKTETDFVETNFDDKNGNAKILKRLETVPDIKRDTSGITTQYIATGIGKDNASY